MVTLKLTPLQAHILWNVVDGAADAGACEGGNTKQEAKALEAIAGKLLKQRDQWRNAKVKKG